jgi:hypothetical protein
MNISTYNSITLLRRIPEEPTGRGVTTQKPDKVPLEGAVGVLPSRPPQFAVAHQKIYARPSGRGAEDWTGGVVIKGWSMPST